MAILFSFIFCVFFVASSLFAVDVQQQVPLIKDGDVDLIYELKKAEIIPTVIDTFIPLATLNITWSNATAHYGNTVNPSLTQSVPNVMLLGSDSEPFISSKHPQVVVALTDPDAPSRDNPEWSEICHWVVTALPNKAADGTVEMRFPDGVEEVMEYKPPGPPPETGKHRYVFVAMVARNGTMDELHLKKPADRQHWGYENEREGLRGWMGEMGLEVIAANFIYEQNDEQ
ncbi:carboxypeptidase Y inhibitor [Saxophila tyrrhenica]|uniref:Carboxypeptidase Y inhibitor n=1 Tax=Saxophila tyrrhenica TaxID=1690608 RepID=A0AAV9PL81_9PEZI|nr:carboxypeptidase Y inhibitor [Saxophila tyrrhenica]